MQLAVEMALLLCVPSALPFSSVLLNSRIVSRLHNQPVFTFI